MLARLQGTGDVEVFGSGDYAMRLWLDPGKIAARNMDVDEVLAAVREQNVQVAAGQIGGQPSLPGTQFQYIVNAQGRLQTEQEFENIVVKNGANGETTYLRDVARLELGPDTYALRSMLDGGPAVAIPVFQLPGANALELSTSVRATMKELAKSFPEGVSYEIDYDPTVFVRSSIEAVVHTLFEAVLLVVLVVVSYSCRPGAPASFRSWPCPWPSSAPWRRCSPPDSRSTRSRFSAWCSRPASSWTTPSWWWRTSSARSRTA